jgi:hypothetical protein
VGVYGVQVTHTPSGSTLRISLRIELPGRAYDLIARLGDDPSSSITSASTFDELGGRVQSWADRVAEWVDTPDLWKTLSEHSGIPGELTPDSDNTQFSSDEQKAIADQLKAIAETVKQTYDLTAEQSAALDEKFEEAAKASERVSRKDWGLLVGGTVFSLILADVITPGVAGHILMMIEHGIGHLFAGATPAKHVLSEG